jgi:5-methylthioadenosine/S-adenosylhomocysteine deaminase
MALRAKVVLMILLFFALMPLARSQETYALSGIVWTPSGFVQHAVVVISNGIIERVDTADIRLPTGVKVVNTGGVIFPGLIDLHNHLTWNVFPRWTPPVPVGDRYEWQALPQYAEQLSNPEGKLIGNNLGCEMERYGEVKALLGGATSTVGSFSPIDTDPLRNDCDKGLARNLDFASGLYSQNVNQEPLRYEVFPLQLPWKEAEAIRGGLASRTLKAFLIHVSEGDDASAAREFKMIKARGFLQAGVSIIHGVAFGPADFKELATNGVGFIWSPRSNFELYGKTADVRSAKQAGLTIALAPDWSPTGSTGLLQELRFAYHWNRQQTPEVFDDQDLIRMVTEKPAKLIGASDKIGALKAGMVADLIVLPLSGTSPALALLDSKAGSIALAVVGGKPLLGTPALMRQVPTTGNVELITVCGSQKALAITGDTQGESWQAIESKLSSSLQTLNISLAGLAECN